MNDHLNAPRCFIAIDAGTTNTRVWLVNDDQPAVRASAMIGVRDTAHDGNNRKLLVTLRELIESVCSQAPELQPECIAAAGMITSPLGLREVPHVQVPATAEMIARQAWRGLMPELSELPVILFGGVKSGDLLSAEWTSSDVMRGEETLCLGMNHRAPFTVLNLGSHWKVIELDEQRRIARSRTTLSGELVMATQTNTILASALPEGKLSQLDCEWFEQGSAEWWRSGLARALFCVRLLELQGHTSAEQRMSFLLGVYVAADLAALRQCGFLPDVHPVLLTGSGAVVTAWEAGLIKAGVPSEVVMPELVETNYLKGIQLLLAERGA